jgi:hypothetical protein
MQEKSQSEEIEVGDIMAKKQSKAEKLAKARAYSKKMTHGKAMDAYSAMGAVVDNGLKAMQSGNFGYLADIPRDYTGVDIQRGGVKPEYLWRGYAGPFMNAVERGAYNALNITRPRTEVKNIGDALDYLTYHGAAGWKAYQNRDNYVEANREFYRTHFGVDLGQVGSQVLDPGDMFWEKELPYVLQRKIRQIPFIKRQFQKINNFLKFGG